MANRPTRVIDQPPEGPDAPRVECPSCHRQVFEREIVQISGRSICSGCANAWFEEEEDDQEPD